MNIIICGYGRMGKEVEDYAQREGHGIVGIIRQDTPLTSAMLDEADAVIDFSVTEAVEAHAMAAFEQGVPYLCGVTGLGRLQFILEKECEMGEAACIFASNFSPGVNLMFMLNEQLCKSMEKLKGYTPSIYEAHHINKKDAPSGTASFIS